MLKWLLLIVVGAGFVFWLKRGKKGHDITDPEVKEIDQQRYYVNPSDKESSAPKDNQSNDL